MRQAAVLIATVLLVLSLATATRASSGGSVLVIQSYHQSMPWVVQCERGLRRALGGGYNLQFFYMDTKRLPPAEFDAKADEAWRLFISNRPDAVVLGDDNALRLLGPRLVKTGIPTIYFGINNNPRLYFDALPANLGGVQERLPIFPWVRLLKDIVPNMRHVLLMLDASTTSDAILDSSFKAGNTARLGGTIIHYLATSDWEKWQNAVEQNTSFEVVILATFHNLKDASGEHVSVEQVIEWTSEASRVPVFSYQDYTVHDRGLVGAYVMPGEAQGRMAGEIVRAALETGISPKLVHPREENEGHLFFNETQLKRHGLSLPPHISEKATLR